MFKNKEEFEVTFKFEDWESQIVEKYLLILQWKY